LDPVQRWYRILSEALKRYLKGRQLALLDRCTVRA
jgi:hypothetical protein